MTVHDLRDFTTDRHRVVDDVPYGGGPGMVLKPEPLFRALDAIERRRAGGHAAACRADVAAGRAVHAGGGERLSRRAHLVLLCGRYEGVDERVRARVDEELSIGDYVLSGGELPALVIVDAVARLVPGVVGDEQSVAEESFSRGLLDFPHYTRPAELAATGRQRRRDAERCRTCCCRAIMRRSGGGGSARRSSGRWRGGRICWRTPRSTTRNSRFCASCVARQETAKEHDDECDWT